MELYKNKDWLQKEYIIKKKSLVEIAKQFNFTYQGIRYWMKKLDIPIRKKGYNDGSRRKYFFNQEMFAKCDTSEKAYWLGYLMADGCVQEGKSGDLGLSIVSKDKEIPTKFKNYFNLPQKIYPKFTRGRKYYVLRIFSKILVNDLFRYGIVFRKTGKEQIKNIPVKYHRHFIRGFFDGDGCISLDGKTLHVDFCSSSRKILNQIQNILMKKCSLNKTKTIFTKTPWGYCFRFAYRGNVQVGRIGNYFYNNATVFLERKHRRFHSYA